MNRAALLIPLVLAVCAPARAQSPIHYSMRVEVDPPAHRLRIEAEVRLAGGTRPPDEFLLAGPLKIVSATPPVEEIAPDAAGTGTIAPDAAQRSRVRCYRFLAGPSATPVRLAYEGVIDYPLSAQKEEYTRGFRETPGFIGPEGLYLAGGSYWYPHFGENLVTFDLAAGAPDGWHLIAQGEGTSRDAGGTARWRTRAAMDEIFLVGGPLRVWRDTAGAVETLVYLHDDDRPLAARYLAATAQYLEMYRDLIGPYPYGKFALVENFWETGYGMPSFTLLGRSIVRFPWILTSSYPHEILHNWWGNGVLVDYGTGNWSEGLTAYLADHLVQEQRGKGDEYRRATLQKYRDYVKTGRDFPLTGFRSRESAATEAVGYGKTLMAVHMLRRQLGDAGFRQLLAQFYRDYRGRRAGFADLQKTAESVSGRSLETFFHDWVRRPGAPELAIEADPVRRDGGIFVVEGKLFQRQRDEPFRVDVPVVLSTNTGTTGTAVSMTGRTASFSLRSEAEPLALFVDPQFDVFRRLDARETPASIGQIFGEPQVTAVLPSRASAAASDAYRRLIDAWQSDAHRLQITTDAELQRLPADRAVWLFGRENVLAQAIFASRGPVRVEADGLRLGTDRVSWQGHTAVVTARHPGNPDKAVGWIVVDPLDAAAGLARKLPHYGRYSYLAFEGTEPSNTLKGEWTATDSPLVVDLRAEDSRSAPLPSPRRSARKPLAELPPAFPQNGFREHVSWLAAPEREGRGLGSEGLKAAAEYVARRFEQAGLVPGGEQRSWLQPFTVERGPSGTPVTAANVVGYVPGTRKDWEGEWVLVTAHYDHLGRGWPEAHAGDAGRIHPGADDNASGVAVLIELARAIAAGDRPQRAVVFAAFSAEEAGLAGSSHFAEHPTPFPLAGLTSVVNLDTVGRLGAGKVTILGADSATEWPHIFRGASFVTGIESAPVPGNDEASDQRPFRDRGIPAVQVFTGAHDDYHRPGDTVDKVDVEGLVKVATLVKEAVDYLADRAEPLTRPASSPSASRRPDGAGSSSPGPGASGPRRVTFGVVPDFTHSGQGVRLDGVTAGSPAETAGMRPGDVVVRLGGTPIASLRDFAEALRGLSPGQRIEVVFVRDGREQVAAVTVAQR